MEIAILLLIVGLMFYHQAVLKDKLESMHGRIWQAENALHEIKRHIEKSVQTETKSDIHTPQTETIKEEVEVPQLSTFKTIGYTEVEENEIEVETLVPEPQASYEHSELPAIEEPEETLSWYSKFSRNNPDLERFIGENLI